jgi:hypothetical protein
MRNLRKFRTGRPACYPDQAVYAAFACAEFGLTFQDIDGGTGLLFRVASRTRSIHFGAGRGSWYPQNNSTAATLAFDKYFAHRILEEAGVATLGGNYFFLSERLRAHRPAGHERDDAFAFFRELDCVAFVKPLAGSRGDFAQAIRGEDALGRYLQTVSLHYDSVLIQPIATGNEYRVFLLDDEVVYCVRKSPPVLVGDGLRTRRDLLIEYGTALQARGLSTLAPAALDEPAFDVIPPAGERWEIAGRMNLSAGGTMAFELPRSGQAVTMARKAARALGLRVAAVDLFTDVGGAADAIRIIEVNSNPSIRFLEESDRGDLILRVWRHTFLAMGLLDV